VILRLDRPDLLGDLDLDLLILTVRLRFLISTGEPCDMASEEDFRRRRSLTGLLELLGDLLRRRGGVRDLDSLGGGDFDLALPFGVTDGEVSLGSLLLSWLGDHDLSLLRRGRGDVDSRDGERRVRRGRGDLERSDEGDLRTRRRGGVRERERGRSGEGERRTRRGGGEAERLPDGERRRSRDLSRPPRPRPRPPSGTYMSRSRRGGGDRRLLLPVSACSLCETCTAYGGDRECLRGGPRSKSRPRPRPPPLRSPPLRSSPRNLPPRPRSGRSDRSGRSGGVARSSRRNESIMSFCSWPSRRRCSAAALESFGQCQPCHTFSTSGSHLFLLQLQLLRLEQLARHAHWTVLRTQHEVP
jgi:hypothetical protein